MAPQDTKGGEHRLIYLTKRVVEALRLQPVMLHCEYVFVNPKTGKPWTNIRHMFNRACRKAGLPDGIWIHDQRRSFITNTRRRGVPEFVVMKMSGHRTRAVFDRYNINNDEDLRQAKETIKAGATRELGQVLEKVDEPSTRATNSQARNRWKTVGK